MRRVAGLEHGHGGTEISFPCNADDQGLMQPLPIILLTTSPSAQAAPADIRFEPNVIQTITASDSEGSYFFGRDLDTAGDLNSDGLPDAVMGDSLNHTSGTYEGAAYIFLGTTSGTLEEHLVLRPSDGSTSDDYGWRVVGDVDLNGDGFGDVAVSAPWTDDFGTSSGSIYLYYGTITSLDSTEHKLFEDAAAEGHSFGWDLDSAGDINDDGFSDLIAGGTYEYETSPGAVFLLYGSSSGIGWQQRVEPSDGVVDDRYGREVSGAGDVNADGFSDIIVESDYRDTETIEYAGAAYVHFGSASGVVGEQILLSSDLAAGDYFADSVSGAGDVDSDGYDDVLVGASGADEAASASGAFYIFYGSVSGISAREDKRYAPDGEYTDFMGANVWDLGDVDFDGFGDVVAYSGADNIGAGYLFYGASSGISWEYHKLYPPEMNSGNGMPQSAAFLGDLTGDGYGEFLFGSTDNRAYLFSAGPEDADGDGYSSVEDCDDTEDSIHPGAEEVCGDGIDNNCDGFGTADDDEDGDGLSSEEEEDIGSDPCDEDTDGDGISDGDEVAAGTDPLTPEGTDTADTAPPDDTGSAVEDSGTPDDTGTPRACGCAATAPTTLLPSLMIPVLLLLRRFNTRRPGHR